MQGARCREQGARRTTRPRAPVRPSGIIDSSWSRTASNLWISAHDDKLTIGNIASSKEASSKRQGAMSKGQGRTHLAVCQARRRDPWQSL